MIPRICRSLGATLILALTLPSNPAEAGGTGQVAPKVKWAEGDASTCRFGVLGEARTQSVTSLLELPPGAYRISVRCGEDPELIPPPIEVKIRAGKVARPKFDVARAKIRVMTERDGTMKPGRVQFFSVGGAFEDEPIVEAATNSTVKLAAGRYAVRVTLAVDDLPAAEAFLPKLNLRGGRNPDAVIDLSDGAIVVRASENRKRTEAAVRVFATGTERRIALGEAGQELRLPAGQYDVKVGLRNAANFASETKTVWVRAKKTTKVDAKFKTGKLAVKVLQDGKPIDATVRLQLPLASDFFNFFDAPGPAVLSPGRYSVVVDADLAKALGEVRRTDVVIKAKRTTNLKFDLSPATLEAVVTKNGKTIDAIVEVREPGGGDVVARISKQSARLWPGRYELYAKLPDGAEKVDGPFEVKLGQRYKRKVTFERATLRVDAARGPAPEVGAKIYVFRRGAAKPVAEGKPSERIELSEGTYDIKVVAGPDTVWKQGVDVAGNARVQVALPELAGAEALPAGEAPADDFELPDGDANE